MSKISRITFEKTSSCKVDLKASIIYAGSLLINPTVSENIILFPPTLTILLDVDSVVNNSIPTNFDSPVTKLNRVVFPTDVYPISDTVGKPDLALPVLWTSFLFSSFKTFFLSTEILLLMSSR
jgi:hypothetical protein